MCGYLRVCRISVSSEEYLSEAEQHEQDLLDIRCLQVLRALIHNQIKMIDPELKDRDPVVYRRCVAQRRVLLLCFKDVSGILSVLVPSTQSHTSPVVVVF